MAAKSTLIEKSYFPLSCCNLDHQAITTNLWVVYLIYANLLLTCLRYHLHHPSLIYLLFKILAVYENEIFSRINHFCCDNLLKSGPRSGRLYTKPLQMKCNLKRLR